MSGVKIRPALPLDAPAIARVHVASWHAAYRGLLPQEHIERRTVAMRTSQWREHLKDGEQIIFVATDDHGTIAGFASGGASTEPVDGFDGELTALYLASEAWGRGIGRALVHAVGTALRERGFRSAWVRVLAANPACAFYEKLGAEFVCDAEEEIDGFIYKERFYGWRDAGAM